jgi:hypothetical protein
VGWWNKLWLFSAAAFEAGERVLYFDLDVLIMGSMDELAAYDGKFAILRDFYDPRIYNSSVMAWVAGPDVERIWAGYVSAGCPDIPGGDQKWITHCKPDAVMIQDAFPGIAVSYKAHCFPYPPKGSKIVVMHGEPRPHNCPTEWVQEVWKKDGIGNVDMELICNAADEERIANVRSAIARGLPELTHDKPNNGVVCIVGGGPSVAKNALELQARANSNQQIWALNGAHDWLISKGITPNAAWLVDARRENVRFFTKPVWGCDYYIASQCSPAVFDALSGYDVTLWHDIGCGPILPDGATLVGGGTTVLGKALVGAYACGFRYIHLFGVDSSFENDRHAYPQTLTSAETSTIDAWVNGERFKTAPWMAQQVTDFQDLAHELMAQGCEISVHGSGLLPYVVKLMAKGDPEHPFDTFEYPASGGNPAKPSGNRSRGQRSISEIWR